MRHPLVFDLLEITLKTGFICNKETKLAAPFFRLNVYEQSTFQLMIHDRE